MASEVKQGMNGEVPNTVTEMTNVVNSMTNAVNPVTNAMNILNNGVDKLTNVIVITQPNVVTSESPPQLIAQQGVVQTTTELPTLLITPQSIQQTANVQSLIIPPQNEQTATTPILISQQSAAVMESTPSLITPQNVPTAGSQTLLVMQQPNIQATTMSPLATATTLSSPPLSKDDNKKLSFTKIPKEERICLVCGDRANGVHYNVLSCEGCKSFFLRSAKSKAVFTCTQGGTCSMDLYTRRHCPACRMQRCKELGMSLDSKWVYL